MANTSLLALSFVLLITGVFSTATSSAGIQAYDQVQLKDFKEKNINTFNFLIFNVVSGIVVILIASVGLYFGTKGGSAASAGYTDMSSM